MCIDESGDHTIRGQNESDHNTILINLEIPKTKRHRPDKLTRWNTNAPTEKFDKFRLKLASMRWKVAELMKHKDKPISERYTGVEKLLYKAAISTIGKTTYKPSGLPKVSGDMKSLRNERRALKKEFEQETDPCKKKEKMESYIKKQHEIKELAVTEESARMNKNFKKMRQGGVNAFWDVRKKMKKDESTTWLITKDKHGKRIYDPEMNKENIADYYENLYSKGQFEPHAYHNEVENAIITLTNNREEGLPENDGPPSEIEIKEAIEKKKNGKATTDWKNEIIKKGGNEMVKFIAPVIQAFWEEECSPKQWNFGLITNVWKGKGDRECMENQRGITVSSTISTIAEEIIFNRITKLVKFTQSQAGGRKHGSTTDHVFIVRNLIAIGKKERRNFIITYYDVVKAYDRADLSDMCYSMYQNGIEGKLWRLMKAMNEDLTAKIKTKAGLTREIQRETGGKQGGKLMVSLFAKMMDNLSEDLMNDHSFGILIGSSRITLLLYVDDAMSFAEGYEQQEKTLKQVSEFSKKHKLEWGAHKCKTMEIGCHKETNSSWMLGDQTIHKCDTYKYLGDIIHRNGKNNDNLKERCDKLRNTVRAIITCCKSEIMQKVGVKALLKLHEAETMSAFSYNAETWTLNKSECQLLEKTELFALKKMIGLPQTTPTAGIIFTLGTQSTSIRIHTKQLLYLHKILQKEGSHWARVTLDTINQYNIGWAKCVNELLEKWELELDWVTIQQKPFPIWKREVMMAAEKQNKQKLIDECETKSRGETKQKTKTKFVASMLDKTEFCRKTDAFIDKHPSILFTRALIMGRYGMLACANNFSNGYGTKNCNTCNVLDNESHRINDCKRWERLNRYNCEEKIAFEDIYSDNDEKCLTVVKAILSLWDLNNGKNDICPID